MKRFIILLLALILTLCLASCGGDNDEAATSSDSDSANGAASETSQDGNSKDGKYPAFSGDTLELFGLEWEDAFEAMGDGSTSDGGNFISNDEIGLYASLTNHIEDMATDRVGTVAIEKVGDVSFYGLKVGDTLKDADKLFMDNGASYNGELNWQIEIDGKTFSVKLTTSDNKTIDSIEATDLNASGALDHGDAEEEIPDNPYSYEQDLHEFEPIYWE